MEVINHTTKHTDTQLLVLTQISQLLGYLIGFGSLIAPLIIWLTKRDSVIGMDEHGKNAVNFQISLLLYIFISIPLIFFFGLGILTLIFACIVGFSTGVVKEIGNVDGNGFATTVIIRDQDAQITYNASSGSITITSLRNGDGDNFKLINGNFNVTATTNTGETVTMTGNFKNIEYLD